MSDATTVIQKVRLALGRTTPLDKAPIPPAIDEPITRLVHSDIGLPELFAKRASDNHMQVETVSPEDLMAKLIAFLHSRNCKRLALPASPFLENLSVPAGLRSAGFETTLWPDMTLDQLYDYDCGVTDVYCAVAETGSLVVQTSPKHGRSLSLVPPIHVAILEPKNFVADLVDLFEKLTREGTGSATSIISGPSKTADIEMSMVEGVHGPGLVKLFILG